jgi:hypothetical protein
MDPFGEQLSGGSSEVVPTNRCQAGAEIILKRIFKKLFNQVNALQPTELDDEFIYQSTISYDDYQTMVKQIQDDQVNCASLNRLENIMSNFMSSAIVRRPMHTSLFSNFLSSGLLGPVNPLMSNYASEALNIHLLTVLFIVGLTTWIFHHVVGMRSWRSLPLSIVLVGFVEFCIHKNELFMNHRLNLERCRNPSTMARLSSWVNYDYDGCRSDSATTIPNIAFTGVEYLSELVLQPIVHLGEKLGKALQSYLNSFTGVNYLLAPFFPIVLTAVGCLGVPLLLYLCLRNKQHAQYIQLPPSSHKAIQSPKKSRNSNNMTQNR